MNRYSREAIVVGLCAHGLDLVHALAGQGVRVHALEAKRNLPGVKTKLATVHLVKDINGPELVPSILAVTEELNSPEPPVLILTNDKMVFAAAEGIRLLEQKVMVSWSNSHQLVSTLLLKDNLPDLCARSGLNYPRSTIISSPLPNVIESAVGQLRFPIMAKPVKPMASFKAVLLQSPEELSRHVENHVLDLPIVVQEWVPGDVTSLKFCAVYFDEGRPVTHFEGRKLDTLPRGTGDHDSGRRHQVSRALRGCAPILRRSQNQRARFARVQGGPIRSALGDRAHRISHRLLGRMLHFKWRQPAICRVLPPSRHSGSRSGAYVLESLGRSRTQPGVTADSAETEARGCSQSLAPNADLRFDPGSASVVQSDRPMDLTLAREPDAPHLEADALEFTLSLRRP